MAEQFGSYPKAQTIHKEETTHPDEATFLTFLQSYQQRSFDENLELVLHVFTNNSNGWTKDPHIAYEIYQALIEQDLPSRLYVGLYIDRENDIVAYEECLLSYGEYPS